MCHLTSDLDVSGQCLLRQLERAFRVLWGPDLCDPITPLPPGILNVNSLLYCCKPLHRAMEKFSVFNDLYFSFFFKMVIISCDFPCRHDRPFSGRENRTHQSIKTKTIRIEDV